jgi:hypothetical protein
MLYSITKILLFYIEKSSNYSDLKGVTKRVDR